MSRVLVIDDELSIRRVLRSILERAGHTVLDAPDGRKGLALWRQEPTDVVVTDIFMPETDGIEVILEMKNSATKPKIIAMSGGAQRGILNWNSAALALGADRVLEKPFDPGMFLVTVQGVLGNRPDTQNPVLPSSATDQRKNPRLPAFLTVSFGDDVIAQIGTVVDISHEGCRIRCSDLPSEVKYLQVEIRLEEPHGTLTVDLAVRRWSRNDELGTEFIRMDPDQQALLLSVIRRREEISSR